MRINSNIGFVFAGYTGTGVLGIQTTRGHVYTGGLSVQRDVTAGLTLLFVKARGVSRTFFL